MLGSRKITATLSGETVEVSLARGCVCREAFYGCCCG
jgi:hypothetical protein